MTSPSSSKSFIRQALTENLALKIIGLVASIALFVIVRGTEDAQSQVRVEVVALLPQESSDQMLVSEVPSEIRLTLRGPRSMLSNLQRSRIPPIEMDLRDTSQRFYYFNQEAIEVPAGVRIVQVAPAAIPLTWVERGEDRVPVEPLLDGQVADNHLVMGTTVDPPNVLIRGAAGEVARIESVRTQAVDVTGLGSGRHRIRVPLTPLTEHVSYVETETVMVTVLIDEEEGTRTFSDVDVTVIGRGGVTARPAQVSVRVVGPSAIVDELSDRHIVATVDASPLDPERGAQPVAVQLRPLPEGVAATIEPAEVLVVPAAR